MNKQKARTIFIAVIVFLLLFYTFILYLSIQDVIRRNTFGNIFSLIFFLIFPILLGLRWKYAWFIKRRALLLYQQAEREDRELLVHELKSLHESIKDSFPHADIQKMQTNERLVSHFNALGENDWFDVDFSTYIMHVDWIASLILQDTKSDTAEKGLQCHLLLFKDFFAIFPLYRFLEDEWEQFPQFAHIYVSIKRMQEIEVALLITTDKLLALKEQAVSSQGAGIFLRT